MSEIVANVPRFSDYLRGHGLSDFGIFLEYIDSLPVIDKIAIYLESNIIKRSPSSSMFQEVVSILTESPRLRSNLTLYIPFPTKEVGGMQIGDSHYVPYISMTTRDPGTLDSDRFSADCCVAAITVSPATHGVLPIESLSARGRSGAEVVIGPGHFRLQDKEIIQVGSRAQPVHIYYMNYLPDPESNLQAYIQKSKEEIRAETMKFFVDFVRQNVYHQALRGNRIQNIHSLRELTGNTYIGKGLNEVDDVVIDIIKSNLD